VGIEAIHGRGIIVHVSTVDAVFRDSEGRPVAMEFHPYCGPAFLDRDEEPVYPDEGDSLWDQFDGWWEAKGKAIYRPEESKS
jgi:hypothetical protein